MRWVTREKAKVDRIACPWLIRKFIDSDAEFVFLSHDTDWSAITDGMVFDVPGAALGHHSEHCSFDAIIARYGLDHDAALIELAGSSAQQTRREKTGRRRVSVSKR
jgi:hypothetical protein